ncbi:MAG: hypothetical protein ACI81O_001843 [Cyclobacteriaceae bacterium]|jgi:hypothetical protein
MLVHQLANLAEYVKFLLSYPSEIDLLFKELLIGLTHFFRDSEVFHGLKSHLEELSNAHDDMHNLLDRTDIATIFLEVDLGIRRSTPSITRIVPITMADVGRPIADFATNLLNVDITSQAAEVLVTLSGRESRFAKRLLTVARVNFGEKSLICRLCWI